MAKLLVLLIEIHDKERHLGTICRGAFVNLLLFYHENLPMEVLCFSGKIPSMIL